MNTQEALTTDANTLTKLTLRSKSYWGYSEAQIEEWVEELTITKKYIEENQIFKLVLDDQLVGFYAFGTESETAVKLNYLFVEPKYIGKGYGKILIVDCIDRIRTAGYIRITLDADPNAEKFYSKNGFKVIGKLKSSIKDRYLPIMEMKLD